MNSVNFVNSEGFRSAFHLGKLVESTVGSGFHSGEGRAGPETGREELRLQDLLKDRDLDLAPGAVEDPSDVVRTYLREAGRISLLTRRAEVEVAKRIERGQLNTLKALSRSTMVIEQMSALRRELSTGKRPLEEIVTPGQHEWTDEGAVRRRCEVIAIANQIERLNRQLARLKAKSNTNPSSRRGRTC